MKTKSLMCMLTLICVSSVAYSASCEEWENKLQGEIRAVNGCEPKHQACLAKEFGNPMRELDYCKKVLKNSHFLKQQVPTYHRSDSFCGKLLWQIYL